MSRLLSFVSAVAIMAVSASGFADANTIAQSNTNNNQQSGQTVKKEQQRKEFFPSGQAMPEHTIQRNEYCTKENEKNKNDKCKAINEKYPAAYNRPARIDPDVGWDLNVMASFIYWNVSQDAMDIAYTDPCQGLCPDGPFAIGYQNFEYNPGFKVGLGMGSDFDGWTFDAIYTWLHFKNSQSNVTPANAEGGDCPPAGEECEWTVGCQYFPFQCDNFVTGPSFNSTWRVKYDNLDFVLGRPFYQGTKLVVLPSGGLRAMWLRQKSNVTVTAADGTESTSLNTQKSWNLGPVANMNTHWNFFKGARIDGQFGMSLLYTRIEKVKHTDSGFSVSQKDQQSLTPTLNMGLGLGFGGYMMKNKFFFDLAARYDFTMIWNQNFYTQLNQALCGASIPAGNLRMHGLTIDLTVGF